MQSRTSFFNKAVFAKSISRFWPLWAAYLGIWLLILPIPLLSRRFDYVWYSLDAAEYILGTGLYGGVVLGAIFAVAVCMAIWCFLYNNRGAHGMACLPLRREGLFCSVMLAGLLPAWAVQLSVAVLAWLVGAVGGLGGSGALLAGYLAQWFGTVALTYLFFYGFATLCAMLTGNVVILMLVYGVLNFVAVGVEVLIRGVFAQFVYGLPAVGLTMPTTRWLSPVVGYLSSVSVNVHGPTLARLSGWSALWLYALAGVLLLIGALLLFRRRRMESAGDVVAVQVLKPIFRWCMALGVGLVLSSLLYTLFFYNGGEGRSNAAFVFTLIFLLIGALIGWFVGEMLVRKSFRVFNGKRWAGYGIVCAVILVAMLGMRFDLFGVERRVPQTDRVDSVEVHAHGVSAVLTTPEGVDRARELHRAILADKSYNDRDRTVYYESGNVYAIMTTIRYHLKGGGTVEREYWLSYPEDDPRSRGEAGLLQDLMNCPEAVSNRKRTSSEVTRERVIGGSVQTVMTAGELAEFMGYDSAEEYLLCGYYGLLRSDYLAMDEAERRTEARCAALDSMQSFYFKTGVDVPVYGRFDGGAIDPEDIDLDRVLTTYYLPLSDAEAWSLWENAVRDDVAEGSLGRVYILSDDSYAEETYMTTVTVELRGLAVGELQDVYDRPVTVSSEFTTTVTVDARRTADWIAARGLVLHRPADAENGLLRK